MQSFDLSVLLTCSSPWSQQNSRQQARTSTFRVNSQGWASAEKPSCNLHRNIFDLSWENNWPFAISYLRCYTDFVDAGQKDLFDIHWCGSWWQLCWWILATFMIFPIRCPYLFADHYPENHIQVCIATRDRLTTKSHRSSVCMSTHVRFFFVRTLSMFYQTSPDHRCCSTADVLAK